MAIFRYTYVTAVAALAAAIAGSAAAQDGRLSLAERVARLEQQNQGQPAGGANLELLNRLQDLQAELQSLRNLVEQQSFEIEELKKRQRDQYVDLDSRIERLRGGDAAASGAGDTLDLSAPAAPSTTPPPAVPASPPDPDQLLMEEAAPVDPYTGEPIPSGGAPAASDPAAIPPPSAPGAQAPAADAQADYQAAFDALKQGRYDESTQLFNAFLRTHPDSELADNALYWLGESYYVTQNYETALATFQTLVRDHPQGEKTPDAELKIGYCLYELGQYAQAQAALDGVVQRYPDSTVARLAQSRLRAHALERQ